jgi:ABC-type glycerol-3-phosphate transport system substrate-binding protein
MTHRLRILLAFAALAACSPATSPAASGSIAPHGQTIILWHSAEDGRRRALLAQIDAFNAANPWGILVVPEYRGDAAQLMSALQSAVAAGRAPDLALGRPLDALQLKDAVVPVETYAADPVYGLSEADRADLYPAALDANRNPRFDNSLVSFPAGGEGVVLVTNSDRLAAAGYLTPPDSWPLFREVCLVTTADRNGDRQPDVFGFGLAPRSDFTSAWFVSRGAPLLSPDGRAVGFSNEAGLRLLETLSESAQGGCIFRAPGARADVEAFSAGRVAMIFASTSDLPAIRDAVENRSGFRWGIAPVPHGRLPVTFHVSGPAWIVLRSTSEKQLAAWLFARWFASAEQTLAWALSTGQLPLRASATAQLKELTADNPAYETALDLLAFGHADPLVPYWPDVAEAATRAVLAVAAGEAPSLAHAQALHTVGGFLQP